MPSSGIQYSNELHARLAAAWANYTWEQFLQLDGDEQSAHVAAYEVHAQVESVTAHEQIKAMRRKATLNRASGKKG